MHIKTQKVANAMMEAICRKPALLNKRVQDDLKIFRDDPYEISS